PDGTVYAINWAILNAVGQGPTPSPTSTPIVPTRTLSPSATSTRTSTPLPTPTPACPATNLGSSLPVTVSGNTLGAPNLVGGASCGGGGGSAPDATFLYTAPIAGSYTMDTFGSGFDTVLYVRNATCSGTELACNDDSGSLQSW